MKTHMLMIDNDTDNDALNNEEEQYFGSNPENIDSNSDGICDGMELALTMADLIKALPTVPSQSTPYLEYLGMDGIQLCGVCGEKVVMGVYRIYNPLINTPSPFEITAYAFHFMQKGSFSSEGAENSRIDPIALSAFLNYPTSNQVNPVKRIPEKYYLNQNYPNPFNSRTIMNYQLPITTEVELSIYNLRGQKIVTLVKTQKGAGYHQIEWDATGFSSGVYYYSLKAGEFQDVKKMILLR
jgi:hypothetical protein